MKILYVCKSLPHTYQGGIQTHIWKLSEWMIRLGHKVSILTAGSMKKGLKRRHMEGREIIELPYFPGRRLPALKTTLEEYSFNRSARKWLIENQSDYDIVHLQGRSGNLFLKNRRDLKVPVVNTLHGLVKIEQDRAKGRQIDFDQKLHRHMATWMENMALSNADALIPVSLEMQSELDVRNALLKQKSVQIYNGIDVPNELNNIPTDSDLLLFVGRLTEIKGIFPLVEAMKNVRRDIRLVMIGDGDARPALEEKIKEAGLEHRIQLTGALNGELVQAWIERSAALILPSYHETQGIVLMEANALAKPVIAMDLGGMSEVVEHFENGLLMPDHKPLTISGAVNFLFENRTLMAEMGLKGRRMMQQKFSWEKIAEKTEDLYGRLLFKQQGRPVNIQNASSENEMMPC